MTLLTRHPYPDRLMDSPEALAQRVLNGYRPRVDEAWPGSLKTLINDCLSERPEDRPESMTEVTMIEQPDSP